MAIRKSLLIALFDRKLSTITPTANYVPPAGYPLSSLKSSSLFQSRTRTPDLTADRITTWDLGVNTEADVFMLAGSNAWTLTTGKLQAANDLAFTSGVLESSPGFVPVIATSLGSTYGEFVQPWGRHIIVLLDTPFNRRYWRWRQTDSTNPDGYMEWSVAGLGKSYQLSFESWKKDKEHVGESGLERIARIHEFSFNLITREQATTLENIIDISGSHTRMLVIPEPTMPEMWQTDAIWATVDPKRSFVRECIATTVFEDKRFRGQIRFIEATT